MSQLILYPQSGPATGTNDASSASSPTLADSARRRRMQKALKSQPPDRRDPLLACLNCRPKKVKCHLEPGGCRRCLKLGLTCVVPHEDERKRPASKSHIRKLEERIRELEEELASVRDIASKKPDRGVAKTDSPSSSDMAASETDAEMMTSSPGKPRSDSIIARLCAVQFQLNSDEEGQLHFFGPTSSLHLSESVSSSILHWGASATKGARQREDNISLELQNELLELYWHYQNPVLQVVHKEAFLNDMETGQTRYFSRLLLYCIFACGARISNRPEIRSLAISSSDDMEEEQPYFVKKAVELLQYELKRPQITTIQSLQLLSVMDCARSNDTKGWLYTGDACRLVYDLGLHRDCSGLESANLSQMDIEVRQVVLWGCFVFDRLWALYLGRPNCMKLEDITVSRPGSFASSNISWDMRMSAAWAEVMELVGLICDALNGNEFTRGKADTLSRSLQRWHGGLHESLRYHDQAPPSLYVLHMQYYAALILLHRPIAGFGTSLTVSSQLSPLAAHSRSTCVQSAAQIARLLQDYERVHGNASTLSGVALHIISTAATSLMADLADRKESGTDDLCASQQQFWFLKQCIKSLSELEKTYLVARRVRKMIQLIMRLCNLGEGGHVQRQKRNLAPTSHGADELSAQGLPSTLLDVEEGGFTPQHLEPSTTDMYCDGTMRFPYPFGSPRPSSFEAMHHGGNGEEADGFQGSLIDGLPQPQDLTLLEDDMFSVNQILSASSQLDILYSLESFFGNT